MLIYVGANEQNKTFFQSFLVGNIGAWWSLGTQSLGMPWSKHLVASLFVKSEASQCGIPGIVALRHAFLCYYHSTKLHTYI